TLAVSLFVSHMMLLLRSIFSSTTAMSKTRQDTAEEGIRSHYRQFGEPCDCQELNSGPPEEQSVLLTAEPSLQPVFLDF
ncbi:mCG146322, partial [Mus musculus]